MLCIIIGIVLWWLVVGVLVCCVLFCVVFVCFLIIGVIIFKWFGLFVSVICCIVLYELVVLMLLRWYFILLVYLVVNCKLLFLGKNFIGFVCINFEIIILYGFFKICVKMFKCLWWVMFICIFLIFFFVVIVIVCCNIGISVFIFLIEKCLVLMKFLWRYFLNFLIYVNCLNSVFFLLLFNVILYGVLIFFFN